VAGTGRKGRILKGDIIHFIENRKSQPLKPKVLPGEKQLATAETTKVQMNEGQK
jgi:pyruvate/2-oxoglutarate dehydrogenase complex dihydrolipoamide acyltransferase (E2) component